MNLNTIESGFKQQPGVIAGNNSAPHPDLVGGKRIARGLTGAADLTTSLIVSVKKLISQRRLKPGERLPTERQLAAEFGVNRASVRQALKALVAMGVLVQRVGDGTYVSPKACEVPALPAAGFTQFTENLSIAELFDVRLIAEPALAARAAMNRTAADVTALELAIAGMSDGIDVGVMSLALNGDRMFHERLWNAAGDRLICQILNPIHLVICQSIEASFPLSRYKRMARSYRGVLDAVRSRNPEVASGLMESLLKVTRKDLSGRFPVTRVRRNPATRTSVVTG